MDVTSHAYTVQRDKDFYGQDAEDFKPIMWMQGEKRNFELEAVQFTFGVGARACLGKDVAKLEIYKVLPEQTATVLDAAIKAHGRSYIGTSLTICNGNTGQNIIRSAEFGSITPENAMKWDATEPNRGQFNWGNADAVANFATQNGKQINNDATLMSVMEKHIKQVMGRYKRKCTHWDVVNEALNEDGTNRDNVFLRVIGEQYLPITFHIAAAAGPSSKLYYNDYNFEYGTAKHLSALRIAKLVQSWGVKIDGVGLQGHLVSEPTGTQSEVTPSVAVLTRVLQYHANPGVDVAYTKLDVRSRTPSDAQKLVDAAAT
ncbi:endo-1,4-beta-xylanase [Alternaria panax]|uniref:Beta-xylanase n=1 Tax=Alternaria panax TaxID=48097 RepID=A0AAD4IL11_9PLEO|nr:endo-1,4-beta-xylanase [Alternaria panax]